MASDLPLREPRNRRGAAFRRAVTALAAVLCSTAFAASDADRARAHAQELLTRYKCYICHADREAKAGPAYADVAAYYRGRPDAVTKIATDIRRGLRSGGPWHMPPHPEVTPAEARAMARYIMSLGP